MNIHEILRTTEHRPWEIPNDVWKFYQEWNNAIFLHFQVDLIELKKFVPKELEIDLFDGVPWISVVAFTMEKMRPKNLPPFAPVSNFDEINIRTYVKSPSKTGVYFLSIEAGKQLSCSIAKGVSELPYRFSNIKRTNKTFHSKNSEFSDKLDIEFEIGTELKEKTELDRWLTERYALFQDSGESINEYEIHHVEWPIKQIDIKQLDVNYQRFENLIDGEPSIVHYSKGVKVLAWGKSKKDKTGYNNVYDS
jgi:uncharacterized protein YqjF (DUF2071 family)